MSRSLVRRGTAASLALALLTVAVTAVVCAAAGAAIPTNDPQWTWQNARPRGVAIQAVAPLGAAGVWTAGGAMSALHSTDGGRTWSAVGAFSSFGVSAMVFTDALHGRAVGTDTVNSSTSAGTFYATEDGGLTWSTTSVWQGAWGGFNAVSFPDALHGWAAGPAGNVWATTDGGATWTCETGTHTTVDIVGIRFVSATVGYAVGESGTIIATTDGGDSWATQDSTVKTDLSAVAVAPDGEHAWVVGGDGTILNTSDGHTWTKQHSRATGVLTAVACADENHAWAVGQNGKVWVTADGGVTWDSTFRAADDLYSVATADGRHVWAGGLGGLLYSSADAGVTWDRIGSGLVGPGLTDLDATGPQQAWTVGADGTVLHTSDGGAHWVQQKRATPGDLNAVSMGDARHGVAVGNDGAVIYTRDGSRWQRSARVTRSELTGVEMRGRGQAWAVGNAGVVLHSDDGGRHWKHQRSGTKQELSGVQFLDRRSGWAIGGAGLLLRTTDGGAHWRARTLLPKSKPGLLAVFFLDAKHGWISSAGMGVGYNILRTVDGGRHWTMAPLTYGSFMLGVSFADSLHGLAVGEEGVTYSSDDGGKTWDFHGAVGGVFGLSAVRMTGPDSAWAVGTGTAIVKWRRGR